MNDTVSTPSVDQRTNVFENFWKNKYIFVIIAVNFIIGITCIFSNSFVVSFYKMKRSTIIPMVYIALSSCDILSGVSALLIGIMLINIFYYNENVLRYLVPVVFFFSTLTAHVSIFYNTVLAVMRTISIVIPFYDIKKKLVKSLLLLYPLFWVALTVYEIYFYTHDYCNNHDHDVTSCYLVYFLFLPCVGSSIIQSVSATAERFIYPLLGFALPFAVPSIICAVCCVVQSVVLFRKGNVGDGNHGNEVRQKNITITILQLTIICFICNTINSIAMFIIVMNVFDDTGIDTNVLYCLYITGTMLPFLNSSVNPMILIIRGQELREHVKSKLHWII